MNDKSAEGAYYYINDYLGAPQIITDDSGSVVWQAEYLPFGNVNILTAEIENNLRFPGQYYDDETGLHYNWNRYYSPETGRYISSDPIGLDGGMNLYAYVGGNPVNFVDPPGLSTVDTYCKRYPTSCGKLIKDGTIPVPIPLVPPKDECGSKRCKPCIPPVGTIATDVHQVPPGKPHYPIEGSHVHWFKMNQSPYPDCRCFWKRNFKKPTAGNSTPAGTVPVTPAGGGGPI